MQLRGRAALVGGAFAALLAACGGGSDSPTQPPPPDETLHVVVNGRVERGQTVQLSAVKAAGGAAVSGVTFTAQPADAVQIAADGKAQLLSTGAVTFRATAAGAHGDTAITVATPPSIVLDGIASGNRDVYKVALDGKDLVALTTDPADDVAPSAAAGRVAFVSYRDGNAELYTVPVAGGTATRLTTTADAELAPALSASGATVAYALSPSSGSARIYSIPAAGGAATALTTGFGPPESVEATPAWAPNGGMLAFVSTKGGAVTIYALDVAGGTIAPLAGVGAGPNVEPAFSPDGQRLAFISARSGEARLYLLDRTTGNATEISAAGSAGQPTWLPDGRVVFVRWEANGGSSIAWIDPAAPSVVHAVPLTLTRPQHPGAVR